MLQHAGSVALPAIALDWFNAKSGKVETARLVGVTQMADAPDPSREPPVVQRQIAVLLGALILLWLAVRVARR